MLLGNVIQCGFFDLDNEGYAWIAANKKGIGEDCLQNKLWEFLSLWSYIENFHSSQFEVGCSSHYKKHSRFKSRYNLYWFILRKKINGCVQRIYFFCGESPELYNAAINHPDAVKRLIKCMEVDAEDVIKTGQENKFNIASVKKDYFIKNVLTDPIEIYSLNEMYKSIGLLEPGVSFTSRELDCLKLCIQGKSTKVSTVELGISNRTIEDHFRHIKEKLKVNSKLEIVEHFFRNKRNADAEKEIRQS